MNRLIFSALGLGATLICAMPAAAQDEVSVHVSYADLNLSNPTGLAIFARRIENAVVQICGPKGGMDLNRAALVNSCWTQVGAAAQAQMDRVIAEVQHPQTLASR